MSISQSTREAAKAYYESQRVPFSKLAKDSERLFGDKISVEQLKHWSSQDGGWKKPAISEIEKLNIIAERIFEAIEEADEKTTARDLTALASTYLQFATKMPAETLGDQKPTLQQLMDVVEKRKNALD